MLKQLLNTEFTVNEIMLGIILILGIIIFIKFLSSVIKNKSFKEKSHGPVYKNLIKRNDELKPL